MEVNINGNIRNQQYGERTRATTATGTFTYNLLNITEIRAAMHSRVMRQ
ncbi:MAG: hypothetical protein U0T56_00970 [Ferruginibacter sp.]